MAELNAPIAQRKKQTMKEKQIQKVLENSKDHMISIFFPYISRVVRLLRQHNVSTEYCQASVRTPGQLIVFQSKIQNIFDLMSFFLGVTGELAAADVDVSKMRKFKMADVEDLMEKDFTDSVHGTV